MQRRHIHFPDALWERLTQLSDKEGVAVADTLRRLLGTALGLDDESLASVQLAADQGDPLPKVKRDLIKAQIDQGKLANRVERLALDVQDLTESAGPRQAAWAQLQASVDALHTDTQTHIERAEALFLQTAQAQAVLYEGLTDLQAAEEPRRQGWQQLVDSVSAVYDELQEHITTSQRLMQATAQALAAQHEGMTDLRTECSALRGGIEQLATVCVDLLRRAKATELGGEPPEEALQAIERGERWLNALEADILARTDTGRTGGAHD